MREFLNIFFLVWVFLGVRLMIVTAVKEFSLLRRSNTDTVRHARDSLLWDVTIALKSGSVVLHSSKSWDEVVTLLEADQRAPVHSFTITPALAP